MDETTFLTPAEYAAIVRKKPSTIWRGIRQGRIKAIKNNGRYLIRASTLEKILK